MREETVVKKVKAWFKRHGGECQKIHGGGWNSGFPDIVGVIRGRAVLIECKAPGARLREKLSDTPPRYLELVRKGATLRQAEVLARWRDAGAVTAVVARDEDLAELGKELGLDE